LGCTHPPCPCPFPSGLRGSECLPTFR
jgi:hypothetical protein